MQLMKDGVHIFCLPLRALVQIAWAISEGSRVLGIPSWASDEMYNIDAKVGGEDAVSFGKLSVAQRNQMLQAMLQDRYKLRAHTESRELPVYDLVVAKGGPKLKAATPDEVAKPMLWRRSRLDRFDRDGALFSTFDAGCRRVGPACGESHRTDGQVRLHITVHACDGRGSGFAGSFDLHSHGRGTRIKLVPSKALLDVLVIERVERPDAN